MGFEESINNLKNQLSKTNSFQAKSILLRDFLCNNKCFEKKHYYSEEEKNDPVILAVKKNYGLNDICYETCFALKTCYFEGELVKPGNVKTMYEHVLTGIQEGKIQLDVDVKYFCDLYLELVDALFPHGGGDNMEVYKDQFSDFDIDKTKLDSEEYPSLLCYKHYRKDLLISLICFLLNQRNKESFHLAINYFELYGKKYQINNVTFINAFWGPFRKKDIIDEDFRKKDELDIIEFKRFLQKIDERDLILFLKLFEAESLESASSIRWEQFVKESIEFQNELKIDKENSEGFFVIPTPDLDVKEIEHNINNLLSADLKTIENDNYHEMYKFYQDLWAFYGIFSWVRISNKTKYFLSLLIRDYPELYRKESYNTSSDPNTYSSSLYKMTITMIDERLDDIDKKRTEKLLEEMNSIEKEEIERYCKSFFATIQVGDKIEKLDEASVNKLYTKFSGMKGGEDLVKLIAGAQKFIEPYEKIDQTLAGDFTKLIVTQVKVIERYLKSVIISNMTGEKILSKYNFKQAYDSNLKSESKTPFIIIGEGMTWENLSRQNKAGITNSISIELATASYIIQQNMDKVKDKNAKEEDFKAFFDVQKEYDKRIRSFLYWKDDVRNGYFHSHPIKTLGEALAIHRKTAYCLAKCIELLK